MKVQTINGETLRKEFTALEADALKHAAEYCVEGDQFKGVPTSNDDRWRNSTETFGVVNHDGCTVSIIRHKTGKVLTAKIVGGEGRPTPQSKGQEPNDDDEEMPIPEPESEERDEPQEAQSETKDETQEEAESEPQREEPKAEEATPIPAPETPAPQPNPMDPFSMLVEQVKNAVLAIILPIITSLIDKAKESIMEKIKPMIEEFAKAGGAVKREIVVKIKDMATKIEGLTHPKFERVLKYVANHHNVYLYGPAGSGKNVICEQVAQALGVPFYYQNTIITKFDVTGYKNAAGEFEETEFYKAWTQGGVFMLDEADNACAEALVTLNAALANGYYSFPGIGRVECSPNFYCVAAGNTNGQGATDEYCGRYKMDESSRDRFAFVDIDYDPEIEEGICGGHKDVLDFVRELRSICKEQRISLICGYRAIKNLTMFYDDDAAAIIDDFILKGAEKDTVREIARRLNGSNKYCEAFKKLAEL